MGAWVNHDGKSVGLAASSITMADGTVTPCTFDGASTLTLPMLGITGTISSDGNSITWSNGQQWVRAAVANVNPFPAGISVAGAGAGGAAVLMKTGFVPAWGLWAVDTGHGVVPIYKTLEDMLVVAGAPGTDSMGGAAGFPDLIYVPNPVFLIVGFPAVAQFGKTGFASYQTGSAPDPTDPNNTVMAPMPITPGMDVATLNPDGGLSTVTYKRDLASGYWIPSSARGTGVPSDAFGRMLVMGLVIIAAVVMTAGAAGYLGASGPTAAAAPAADIGTAALPAVTADTSAMTAIPEFATAAAPGGTAVAAGGGAAAAGGGLTSTLTTGAGYISTAVSTAKTVMGLTQHAPGAAAPGGARPGAPGAPGAGVAAGYGGAPGAPGARPLTAAFASLPTWAPGAAIAAAGVLFALLLKK